MANHTCDNCGRSFTAYKPKKAKHVFCSRECYNAKRPSSARVEYECKTCGKKYTRYRSQPSTSFCSRECKHNYGRGKVTKCKTCGREIQQWKCKDKTFCSMECRKKKVTKKCKLCGTEFEYLKSVRKNAAFCSIRCANKAKMTPKTRKKIREAYIRQGHLGRGKNKLEARFANGLPDHIEYVGDHSFWVVFKDGRAKNPDFIVRPFRKTKKVIEIFGGYWHSDSEAEKLVADYAAVGVSCLIVWENEINDDGLNAVKKALDFS